MKTVLMRVLGRVLIVLFFPFKHWIAKRHSKMLEKYISNPSSISDIDAHTILKDLAWKEYEQGNNDQAKKYAFELLRLNKLVEDNWNSGNALFYGHMIIGLVNFESKNIEKAKERLILSSKTHGSPQLDTFGPSLVLAQKLLDAGEIKTVTKFIKNCSKFWEMDNGVIDYWLNEIGEGRCPDLCKGLQYNK